MQSKNIICLNLINMNKKRNIKKMQIKLIVKNILY